MFISPKGWKKIICATKFHSLDVVPSQHYRCPTKPVPGYPMISINKNINLDHQLHALRDDLFVKVDKFPSNKLFQKDTLRGLTGGVSMDSPLAG